MDDAKKLHDKYHIIQQIAKGDRACIYSAINRIDGNMVALKTEMLTHADAKLRHEYKVYHMLAPSLGLPQIYYYRETSANRVMAMELLGLTLDDLFIRCNRSFSLVTTLRVAIQIISRLESLHEQHVIHRDVRPSNFCLGLDSRQDIIYCTNLSLAKKFRDVEKGINHIPMSSKRHKLKVPPLFSSINCMLGLETSRRDDLESLIYMIIYFVKGWLPWEKVDKSNKDAVLQKKQNISIERLADDLPKELKAFFKYIKKLEFEDRPDYDYMRVMLLDVLSKEENNSSPPDWASLIINRDKIVVGNRGIILKPAKHTKTNGIVNTSYQPRRPRTALDRYTLTINYMLILTIIGIHILRKPSDATTTSNFQRPSSAISR